MNIKPSNKKLSIEHLKDKDFNQLWLYVSDPKVTKYLTWKAYTHKEELKKYLSAAKKKKSYPDEVLGIYLNKELIGTIHIILRYNKDIQFGYGLIEKYWSKGYATQAVVLALEHIKSAWLNNIDLSDVEIWADVHKDNLRGKNVALRTGLKLLKKNIEPNRDRYLLSIKKEDTITIKYESFTNNLSEAFCKDLRVLFTFTTGSTAKNSANKYSDVDIWIVTKEESYMEKLAQDLEKIITKISPLQKIYPTTAYHYFGILKNGLILDINIISCPQYFSIISSNKKFMFNKKADAPLSLLNNSALFEDNLSQSPLLNKTYTTQDIDLLFVKAYVGLFRIMSKIYSQEWWKVPRFINSVRESTLLALLKILGNYDIKNIVDVDFAHMSSKHRKLLTLTFPKPESKDALMALRAAKELLYDMYMQHKKCSKDMKKFIIKSDSEIESFLKKYE